MDQMTICGCLLRRLTEQCAFKPHLASGERENTKQMTTIPPLQSLKEEKHPNHQRKRDKNTKVLRVNKMKEERKPEGQEKKYSQNKKGKHWYLGVFLQNVPSQWERENRFDRVLAFVNPERAFAANNQGFYRPKTNGRSCHFVQR